MTKAGTTVKPPAGAELHETELATFWMGADGILMSISKSPTRTIANVSENLATVRTITGGKKVPHLVHLCRSGMPDKATRKFVAEQLPHAYTAMAMISGSGLSKLIMNVLFGLKPPTIPMKTFSDEAAAKAWLRGYL
jgi:hypothetical protein